MKKYYLQIAIVAILCFTIILSCKKIDFPDPAHHCKILETEDRFFTYDDWDRPIAFTYKVDPDATGNPTFYFKYDSKGRLVGYGGFNSHSLTYNLKGQVIIDTFIQNYAGQDDRFLEKIYYDYFGRISKVVSEHYIGEGQPLPEPHLIRTSYYNYDKRGNLIQFDGVKYLQYDNKTNICRTNPIFMLIQRNYSVNNPIGGPMKYNAAGLPDTFYDTFLEGRGVENQIVYACDKKGSK